MDWLRARLQPDEPPLASGRLPYPEYWETLRGEHDEPDRPGRDLRLTWPPVLCSSCGATMVETEPGDRVCLFCD